MTEFLNARSYCGIQLNMYLIKRYRGLLYLSPLFAVEKPLILMSYMLQYAGKSALSYFPYIYASLP